MPDIAWSAGLDLHPLSAASDEDVRWLETLLWPVGDREPDLEREGRLRAAVAIAREHGPTVCEGDLLESTLALVDEARGRAATTVVFHTAVLASVNGSTRWRSLPVQPTFASPWTSIRVRSPTGTAAGCGSWLRTHSGAR